MSGISESMLEEFFVECEEVLSRVGLILTIAEKNLKDSNKKTLSPSEIDSLYRDIHTLKGTSLLFGFKHLASVTHVIEATLEPIRKNIISLDRNTLDILFSAIDLIERITKDPNLEGESSKELKEQVELSIPRLIEHSLQRFGADFVLIDSSIPSELNDDFKTYLNDSEKNQVISSIPENIQPAQDIVSHKETSKSEIKGVIKNMELQEEKNSFKKENIDTPQESSTIRVNVNLLDKLMNLVGEMVLTRNQVLQFAKSSENNEFLNLTQRLDLVTTELQDNVMKTRMQPIGSIFNKFQRVVRDLSRDLKKDIDLRIEGAETELDKSLIEAIKDPLTHIVRNSCDHGLENQEDRLKQNKKAQAGLLLKAYHEGGQVIIEVADDGRGLNPEGIKNKAIENGLITTEKAQSMTEKQLQELIFAPGFSTAKSVSSVSGRGVGMDVVKTNIEKVGGTIDIESEVNKGTTIKMIIPLTLAIVPAMIIRYENDFFAIPQVKLQELIRIDLSETPKAIERLQNQLVFRLRGELISLIHLGDLLGAKKSSQQQELYNIVVLKNEGQTYGLVVDEISNTADIVVKPLPIFMKRIDIYSGSTIMGDGTVALILDVAGMANASGVKASKKNEAIKESLTQFKESTEYLFFKLELKGLFSIPLVLVQRLEEFSIGDIDISGSEMMVKYRNSLLPLIDLANYLDTNVNYNSDDKVSVVVVNKRNRSFGLIVDEIIDVYNSDSELIAPLKEKRGVLGTIVSEDKIVTILDALSIIDHSMGIEVSDKEIKSLKNTRVLFAEDTIFFAKQVCKLLESYQIEVDHAVDGKQALSKLRAAKPGFYQLVLSDIEMPNMTGYELAQEVRALAEFNDLPLIALTTRFNEVDQKRGVDCGFNYYLEKLKTDELMQVISDALGVQS